MKRGVTTLMLVFLASMFAMFVVATWQARLLESIKRNQAMSDVLGAMYAAESAVYDIVDRFVNYPGYSPPDGTSFVDVGTGRKLQVTGSTNAAGQNLLVEAMWPNASMQISLTRLFAELAESNFDKVEIIFALDCTVSMDSKADPGCVGVTGVDCSRRLAKQKESVINFIDSVRNLEFAERSKFYIGLSTFKIGRKWITDGLVEMTPTNNLDRLTSAVQSGFGATVGASSACNIVNPVVPGFGGETSLGSSVVFSDDYLRTTKETRKKQIQIMITDGLPNAALTEARCGTLGCRAMDWGACSNTALDYLECGLADTSTTWKGALVGLKDPDVDVYAVTVLSTPTPGGETVIYNRVVNTFQNYLGARYFSASNANSLPEFLNSIFSDIRSHNATYTIQRVVPPPEL
jgi:hypothetical protein